MNLKTHADSFSVSECFAHNKCEQSVNAEVNLPDYCSDVKRILRCIVTPGVANISVSGESVNLSGVIVTRLLYVGEDDRIDCYEHNSTFNCSTHIKGMTENVCLEAQAKTDYINCRALSQRRISITGSVGINVMAFNEKEMSVISQITDCCAECKKETVRVRHLLCQREKTFDLNETVALSQDKPDIAKIVRLRCYPAVSSEKAVADKLLIKGELRCEILYCTENQSQPQKLTHTMPISQILDMPGIDEKSLLTISLSCRQSVAAVRTDSSGKGRLLEIAARVSAFVRGEKEKDITLISDCYCTDCQVQDEYKYGEFPIVLLSERKRASKDCTVDFSAEKIKEIYDMWHKDTSLSFREKDGEIIGRCDFLLCSVFLDGSSAVRYAEKNCAFEFSAASGIRNENLLCEGRGDIVSLEFSAEKDSIVRVKCELDYNFRADVTEKHKLLTAATGIESKDIESKQSQLILFFARKGQPLWDIGKKYKTGVSVIMEENSLEGEIMEKDGILLIPC